MVVVFLVCELVMFNCLFKKLMLYFELWDEYFVC